MCIALQRDAEKSIAPTEDTSVVGLLHLWGTT
jgi:hypothetical protein